MPAKRLPSRKPPLKACRRCGALAPLDAKICPICGSTEFTESWEGLIIIFDPEKSEVAREINITKPGIYAIKIGGRVVRR
jgi:DNA-directed RNA polymerase subunit E"